MRNRLEKQMVAHLQILWQICRLSLFYEIFCAIDVTTTLHTVKVGEHAPKTDEACLS